MAIPSAPQNKIQLWQYTISKIQHKENMNEALQKIMAAHQFEIQSSRIQNILAAKYLALLRP
jgi:hypothetical protein